MKRKAAARTHAELRIRLKPTDRAVLDAMMRGGGALPLRTVRRARVLQLLDEGWTTTETREAVGVAHSTLRRIVLHYREGGLDRALYDAPRPGGARALDDSAAMRVIAVACGPPPEGFARWTVRLLTQAAPRLAGIPEVGHETIRKVLAAHDLKPWREKNVVRTEADA
jgi:hypothetical protein